MRCVVMLVVLSLVSGCRGDSPAKVLADLEGIADAMCACTDQSCIDQVNGKLERWSSKNRNHRAPPAEEAKIDAALERYAQCMLSPPGE